MQPKTEEFLNFLLWSADKLMRPTFRNLTDSYETWAYRNGLLNQARKLETIQFIERKNDVKKSRLFRLTEQGRIHALGGRDPQQQWTRKWDGQWRLVLFDVPMRQNTRRERLRRYLRSRAFGCLQGSVWITPDPVLGEREILSGGIVDVGSLILLEARPATGESDAEIVEGSWDYVQINQRYARHMEVLDRCPLSNSTDPTAAATLRQWAAEERESWLAAVQSDPLLPECLLPGGYHGQLAWEKRKLVLERAGHYLRTFASALS